MTSDKYFYIVGAIHITPLKQNLSQGAYIEVANKYTLSDHLSNQSE
jgi:hypothetical protein